ncbi:MAG: hypothetical protein KF729_11980 [Sandaracinaceae bacterium]|nr:hypothetical protein [Sandaracinaceae bacterium]
MTPETTHETERDSDARGPLTEASTRAASTLFGIGRLWAAHGLGVGRSALAASARTLAATSELLGELASAFEEERDEPSEPGEPQPGA